MKKRNLETVKKKIAKFSDKKFGKERRYTAPLYHLKKEVKECIKSGEMEEFADMLLLILDAFRKRFPKMHTDELIKASLKKIKVCKKRKWNKPDRNGVVEHIRKMRKKRKILIMESKELAELIRQEAVKLVHESATIQAQNIFNTWVGWKPSYPYGQFNKICGNMFDDCKRNIEILQKIYSAKIEEYVEKYGKEGFVKVISGAKQNNDL